MSDKGHIVHLYNRNTGGKKLNTLHKDVQTKLTKSLLDLIILQILENQPMHGYEVSVKFSRDWTFSLTLVKSRGMSRMLLTYLSLGLSLLGSVKSPSVLRFM